MVVGCEMHETEERTKCGKHGQRVARVIGAHISPIASSPFLSYPFTSSVRKMLEETCEGLWLLKHILSPNDRFDES